MMYDGGGVWVGGKNKRKRKKKKKQPKVFPVTVYRHEVQAQTGFPVALDEGGRTIAFEQHAVDTFGRGV